MATDISEVIDLFMILQNDYRLISLYQTSGSEIFNQYLEGWLMYSIVDFDDICDQDLTYDTTSQTFTETLTIENKTILAQLMIKYWLMKVVQDILQMNNTIIDHDFKTFSQAQNLKEKTASLNSKKEEIAQLLQDYAYKRIDWDSWGTQLFTV